MFDAHFHLIEPGFPLWENAGYVPEPFTWEHYRSRLAFHDIPVRGGAVVSGSFQETDQSWIKHALGKLGPAFVGVTQLPEDVSDEEILDLHQHGVRAARFNIRRGGKDVLRNLAYTADRIYDLAGWHAELYVKVEDLPEISNEIRYLPALSIDHLGLSVDGMRSLLPLVEKGARVKATGFGRVVFDVAERMKEIHAVNPSSLMFGTDLPSTRAPRPFSAEDLQLVTEHFTEKEQEKILFQNAYDWYMRA